MAKGAAKPVAEKIVVGVEYVGAKCELVKRAVIINSIEAGETKSGDNRVWIKVVDVESRVPKTLIAGRIISLFNIDTGEVEAEGEAAGRAIIARLGAPQPEEWPCEHLRIIDSDIVFDGDGYLSGWCFGVQRCFRKALDLEWRSESKLWARGAPPVYGFARGDTLHAPPLRGALAEASWGEQRAVLTASLQVMAAQSDRLLRGCIVPGAVKARLESYQGCAARVIETTQAGLVALLRDGVSGV